MNVPKPDHGPRAYVMALTHEQAILYTCSTTANNLSQGAPSGSCIGRGGKSHDSTRTS